MTAITEGLAGSGPAPAAPKPGQPSIDWLSLLRESAFAAIVALMLTITIIGLKTESVNSRLTIEFRFVEVGIAVALVFLGRISFGILLAGRLREALAIGIVAVLAGTFMPALVPLVPEQLAAGVTRVILGLGGLALIIRAGLKLWQQGKARDPKSQLLNPTIAIGGHDLMSVNARQLSYAVSVAGIIFAFALPFVFYDRYSIDLATLVLTYIMLGWGLNIVVGLAGLLDLGYVAFYAVGAYSYALLAIHFDLSFWVCLPLAGLLGALAGLILGFPVLRLRGDYFAIVTLGFGEIIRVVLINWQSFTGGSDGLLGIPRPSFFGLAEFTRRPGEGVTAFHEMFGLDFDGIHRLIFLYYLVLILALIVNWVSLRLRRLPLGRSWEALREDDIACQALGINRRNIKLAAFTISAAFGGVAGAFFATRQGFISPESFSFIESAIVLAIVVLGGMGSQLGVVLAAIFVIFLPERLRDIEEYRLLMFGAAMVAIMIWRPRGLLANREPTVRLHGDDGPSEAAAAREEQRMAAGAAPAATGGTA